VQYCAEIKKILRLELNSAILRRREKNIVNGTKECNIAQKFKNMRLELNSAILRRREKNIANGTKECNIAQT
jgi:hypothetical protein